ncbi:D-aminoacyl-tRNA deacylase 1 [Geodia barretti]|uniref:D-aminoacyl-tRNA deacylase n=1 Tax=Geodia barretti TaxID=519541 RepID=A0AA35SXI7_GEOBA|nr:D-aminoacyl-tRNA deacylase 1 [Geodia barretti]
MKALVQRVTRASVTVGEREVSAIGKGICVLLGISRDDSPKEAEWLATKLVNLRVFDDPETGKAWDKSVADLGLEILCVSQFTLCHVLKGNKPDFHNAMNSELSKPAYENFLTLLRTKYRPDAVKGGEFGAYMQVHIQNDGPVTLHIESPKFPPPKERKAQGGGGKGSKKGPAKDQSTSSDADSSQQAKVDSAAESVAELTVGDS